MYLKYFLMYNLIIFIKKNEIFVLDKYIDNKINEYCE